MDRPLDFNSNDIITQRLNLKLEVLHSTMFSVIAPNPAARVRFSALPFFTKEYLSEEAYRIYRLYRLHTAYPADSKSLVYKND